MTEDTRRDQGTSLGSALTTEAADVESGFRIRYIASADPFGGDTIFADRRVGSPEVGAHRALRFAAASGSPQLLDAIRWESGDEFLDCLEALAEYGYLIQADRPGGGCKWVVLEDASVPAYLAERTLLEEDGYVIRAAAACGSGEGE